MLKTRLFFVFICWAILTQAQTAKDLSPPTNTFFLELGGTYYGFREELSSALSYEGFGGLHLGLGSHRQKKNDWTEHWGITFQYGEVKAKVNNENDWTNIYAFSAAYSLSKTLLKKRKWTILTGGSVGINGLYTVYPLLFANNGDAYSLDL